MKNYLSCWPQESGLQPGSPKQSELYLKGPTLVGWRQARRPSNKSSSAWIPSHSLCLHTFRNICSRLFVPRLLDRAWSHDGRKGLTTDDDRRSPQGFRLGVDLFRKVIFLRGRLFEVASNRFRNPLFEFRSFSLSRLSVVMFFPFFCSWLFSVYSASKKKRSFVLLPCTQIKLWTFHLFTFFCFKLFSLVKTLSFSFFPFESQSVNFFKEPLHRKTGLNRNLCHFLSLFLFFSFLFSHRYFTGLIRCIMSLLLLLQRIVKDLFSTEEKKRELKWKLNTFWKFSLSQKTSFSQTNGLLCRF
jgi:hypothetical protein